jgi:hypothetical protein
LTEKWRDRDFYLSLDVDLTKIDTKSCFWRQFLCFNTLKIPAPTIEYSHREGFRSRILLLVKFNRLVFSFVNFVVSLQAEIFNTAFWRKHGKEVVFLYKFSYYYSLLSSGFKPLKIEANQWFLIKNTGGIRYLYPSLQQDDYNNLNIPFTGNLFIGFRSTRI